MSTDDQPGERLRAALDELAAADAADVLVEARAEARARVRQILSDALVDATLAQVRRQLGQSAPAAPAPARAEPPERAVPPAPAARPPREPAPREAAPRESTELAWYVYGVIGAEPDPSWTVAGVDRAHPVTTIREGELAAVVSHVALAEFGEARLREHLADMAWVEAAARAHEDVLDQTREQVTVIPMRMCTVYRTETGLREMLRREASALSEALTHLEGKIEVGVKVFADSRQAEAAVEAEDESSALEAEGAGRGAAYMQRRRRERDRADAAAERLEEAASEIHERLRGVAADGLVMPLLRPEASGHAGEMILNGVYLVETDALQTFQGELSELRDAFGPSGLELELTGPWPAYNFVPGTIGAAW